MEDGMTIDGELYLHNTPLQTLSSWVRRKQADTTKLQYYAFDVISNDDTRTRQALLDSICSDISGISPIVRVPTFEAMDDNFSMYTRLNQARDNGYEGLIMRHKEYSYEIGKRSKGLLKVKAWQDNEFLVTDILKSRDGWAILRCACSNGTFDVSAPGTMENKFLIANNPEHYIGRYITINYANLTKDSKPFHPVAVRFKEDV
jgi:ATP-dependent DNA ligase